ncbi:hypothetical protein [Dyadobacter sp. 3J3]|uniref:hypothetical protein n=1 Tax=Dyadobacter sp. 3J3 TaxID=2606600 RepID=UPI0013580643|nr:hypothetical protein [Dyadobacter sp. 3J3]
MEKPSDKPDLILNENFPFRGDECGDWLWDRVLEEAEEREKQKAAALQAKNLATKTESK